MLGVQRPLDGLPCRRGARAAGLLQPREAGEPLPRVLDEALPHLLRQAAPPGDKGSGILQIAGPQFVVDNRRKHIPELGKPPGSSQFGDRIAELAARGSFDGHVQELVFKASNVNRHQPAPLPNPV